MPENELFLNPTVKQVIFQIRYPNLFYLESRIGEFQIEILEHFPNSSLSIRKPIFFADLGSEAKIENLPENMRDTEGARKIWNFSSPKNYDLHVMNDSLDIASNYHKTYDNKDVETRFRDIIEFVVNKFLLIMKVPIITRIGLRYIDECPLPKKNNETYSNFYNSAFNMEKYTLDEALEMEFKTVVSRDKFSLRYVEMLIKEGENYKVILDFDAFSQSIRANEYLDVTDKLHEIVASEYLRTIKEPVKESMRK